MQWDFACRDCWDGWWKAAICNAWNTERKSKSPPCRKGATRVGQPAQSAEADTLNETSNPAQAEDGLEWGSVIRVGSLTRQFLAQHIFDIAELLAQQIQLSRQALNLY
jgi:hypothetical protein